MRISGTGSLAVALGALLLSVVPGAAGPAILTNTDYYAIEGRTPRELMQQMSALGPYDKDGKERFWAHLTWLVTWRYEHRQSGDQCRITSVTTDLRLDYVLPRWTNHDEAEPAFQALWRTFFTALRSHEDQHARHGIDAAREIDAALRNLPGQPTCTELERAANARAGAIADDYAARDVAFDEATRHGSTEGVTMPDFVPPPPGAGAGGGSQRVGIGLSPR